MPFAHLATSARAAVMVLPISIVMVRAMGSASRSSSVAASRIHVRRSAKVVICIADGQPVQAVLPAHYTVDLEALRRLAGAEALRLAHEDEIAALYPEFEVGAMPPFGMMHGHRVFVERCFVGEPEMVFNAGTHTDSLCMHYGDFADIVKPSNGPRNTSPHPDAGACVGCVSMKSQ